MIALKYRFVQYTCTTSRHLGKNDVLAWTVWCTGFIHRREGSRRWFIRQLSRTPWDQKPASAVLSQAAITV